MEWLFLIIIALAMCSIGFYRFLWFISIGYGFAVAGLSIGLIIFFDNKLSILTIIMLIIILVYSLRLAIFLLNRELKNKNYKKIINEVAKNEKKMPIFVSIFTWIACSFLYFAQISPLYFRLSNGMTNNNNVMLVVGICISLSGLILQAVADFQKSKSKKQNPHRFCDKGLFKMVRCPNYFGEILIWTGVIVSSITCLNTVWQWVISVSGYVLIVIIMFNGAKRLEKRQLKNYGEDKDFQEYISKTPIIIPLLPIYSLQKVKWLG